LVNLVNRRICIRIVSFCRSTNEVEMCFGSGSPLRISRRVPVHCAGL
jgi:hypothetical protein